MSFDTKSGRPGQQRSFTRSRSDQTARFSNQRGKSPKRKKSLGFGGRAILLVVMLLAIATVVIIWIVYLSPEAQKQQQAGQKELTGDLSGAGFDFIADKKNRKILHLKPPFVVNLSGLENRYVMKAIIWLEVDDLDVAKEFNENKAMFRRMTDDFVRTLKSWTYAELVVGNMDTNSGMDRLKNQLRDHANTYISRGKVLRVLFPQVHFTEMMPSVARPAGENQ